MLRREALGLCAVSISAASLPAIAQEAPAPKTGAILEDVVITGSRIAAPNMTSTSPIEVVTEKDMKMGGKTDIWDVLNQLPINFNNSLGQDLGNRTSGLTTPGGLATADLRGVGPNRTLVLVNGRRLGVGDSNTAIQQPAPDLDQIPMALVERVEVLTGGASAVYGSDAIAGVVNFIMKRDFEGVQVDGQTSEYMHHNHSDYVREQMVAAGYTPLTGTTHDGRSHSFNVVVGTNLADGRGNITGYFGFLTSDAVPSSARDFGGCQLNINNNLDGAACSGSGNSNWFQPQLNNTTYSVVGNQFIPWGTTNATPPAIFNSQPYIYMGRADQRYNAGFIGHLDINDHAKPYFEFGFMDDRTHQEIAPSALFRDGNPLDPISGNYNVNCSNPLLSAQEAALICTPEQIAADAANPGSVSGNVRIGRRNVEGGGRSSDFRHTNYRTVGGIRGSIATGWSYDAYGEYYYTSFFNSNDRYLNFQAIDNALQVKGTADNPVCISGPPCVPYNIFSDGGVTADQLNYLYLRGTAYGTNSLKVLHGDVTGELGQYGLRLPTSSEGVSVNVGLEHRSEAIKFEPDSAEVSGLLSGFGSAPNPIDRSVSVDEQFVELRVPIAQDRPGIRDLMFDTGFRRSSYTVGGVANTYKFDVQYAPIEGVRLRGSFQRAIRAPSLIELFNSPVVGLIAFGTDPCAPTTTSAGVLVPAVATLEQCMHSGVTAAQYGNGGTTNTIPQGTGSQLSQLTGGNANLHPEVARTYTIGATLTPTGLPGFTGSIDYYHIRLTEAVGVLPATVIMAKCLNDADPFYCSQIVRSNTGGLVGNNLIQGGYIKQLNYNVGAIINSGVDLEAAYHHRLPGDWGSWSLAMNGTYNASAKTTPYTGLHTYECAGLFGSTCQTVNPRWRHNLRLAWDTPWHVEMSLLWRYLGPVSLDNNSSDPTLQYAEFGAYNSFEARIPAYSYVDLAAAWHVTSGVELRAGINNLLDKDPPIITSEIVSGGAANTYETYDTLGRQVFAAFTVKF
jgi:outer membrane receptor protein involved in Fe transport